MSAGGAIEQCTPPRIISSEWPCISGPIFLKGKHQVHFSHLHRLAAEARLRTPVASLPGWGNFGTSVQPQRVNVPTSISLVRNLRTSGKKRSSVWEYLAGRKISRGKGCYSLKGNVTLEVCATRDREGRQVSCCHSGSRERDVQLLKRHSAARRESLCQESWQMARVPPHRSVPT